MARKMKDSGIEWIGEIPEDWEVKKMFHICSTITDYVASGSFASLAENVNYLDEPDYAMLIRIIDLSDKGQNRKPVYVDKYAYDFLHNSNLFGGELLFPNIGAVGDVYIVPKLYTRMTLAPNAIMVKTCIVDKYVYYYFQSKNGRLSLMNIAQSTAQPKFNKTDFRQLKIAVPPIDEQQRIADFLDQKCAQIDEILQKTRDTIAEYKKLKQSIITQAVTKGVRGERPMKDSGIEWIGEIPEEWEIVSLKYLCTMQAGKNLVSEQIKSNGKYPVYGGNGLRGYFDDFNYYDNCLLVGRQGALCGNVHIVSGEFWATEHAVVTHTSYLSKLEYLYYLLIGMNLNQYAANVAAQPGLSVNFILNLKTCLVPIKEQQEVAQYLDQKCTEIDTLIEKKEQLVNELESYKKSLIYEYVTGKKEVLS